MHADSLSQLRPTQLYSGASGRYARATDTLSLSRRTELAADAFTAVGIVRFMNRIASRRVSVEPAGLSTISNGIELVRRLQEGDAYLDQSRILLIPQPESTETVEYMRAHGTSNISARIQEIVLFLERIRSLLTGGHVPELHDLDPELVDSTRAFFRIVHTSIADQLGMSEPPSIHADID